VTDPYEALTCGSYPSASIAYGVGGNGRIIKSNNGGIAWSELSSGTSLDLIRDGCFLNENQGWLLENGNIVLHTENGGDDWTRIDTLPDYAEAFCFTGEQKGWAVANSCIMHTADGGQNWNIQFTAIGYTLRMCDIAFIDDQHGWALGEDTLLRTVNGGQNWTRHPIGCFGLRSICFTDALTGFAAGLSGGIMKTTDGGITWSLRSTGTLTDFEDIYFCDAGHGWAAGIAPGPSFQSIVARTTDGGETWQVIQPPFNQYLYEIAFADSSNGWISGSNGTILHTTDGGLTWEKQNLLTSNYLYNIDFIDKYTGWATGGYGTILKTNHGGMVGTKPTHIPSSKIDMTIWPNPSESTATVRYRLDHPAHVEVVLVGLFGEELRNPTMQNRGPEVLQNQAMQYQAPGNHEMAIDVSQLPEGVYLCRIRVNDNSETRKLIVVHD
jgi:photosystem II stability/assembly factor-like uncharacterized protein